MTVRSIGISSCPGADSPDCKIHYLNSYALRGSDTLRNGQIVKLNSTVSRIVFFIKELFCGGQLKNDKREFAAVYQMAQERIQSLTGELKSVDFSAETFHQVSIALKIEARIVNSIFGKNLKRVEPNYLKYRTQVEKLRLLALSKLGSININPIEERWIRANFSQRLFAVCLNLDEVPYKFCELPRGTILLTDPILFVKSAHLQKKGHLLQRILLHIKAIFCWLGTGLQYTHAELVLGNGDSFDVDKKSGAFFSGEGKIKSRKDKVCYKAIVVPNQEKIFSAHQENYKKRGLQPYETPELLWDAIEKEARESVGMIRANFFDIIKVVSTGSLRTADYDSALSWDPAHKRYACSATLSALLAKFGVDIGEQFQKRDENISPADFYRSHFFKRLYSIHK